MSRFFKDSVVLTQNSSGVSPFSLIYDTMSTLTYNRSTYFSIFRSRLNLFAQLRPSEHTSSMARCRRKELSARLKVVYLETVTWSGGVGRKGGWRMYQRRFIRTTSFLPWEASAPFRSISCNILFTFRKKNGATRDAMSSHENSNYQFVSLPRCLASRRALSAVCCKLTFSQALSRCTAIFNSVTDAD